MHQVVTMNHVFAFVRSEAPDDLQPLVVADKKRIFDARFPGRRR